MRRALMIAICGLGLFGCTAVGPRTAAILRSDNAVVVPASEPTAYVLIEMNQAASEKVTGAVRGARQAFLPNIAAQSMLVGVDDTVQVSIITTSDAGFIDFSQSQISPLSTTNLPPQRVASDGKINVPPLGRVDVRGKSTFEIEQELTQELGAVLIDPTVLVQLIDRQSARVSVLGDVDEPGSYPLVRDRVRLLDVISDAGGPVDRTAFYTVRLDRAGQSGLIDLHDVMSNPQFNVNLRANDVVTVERPSGQFTVLGNVGGGKSFLLDKPRLNLAEALATAGDLIGRRADVKGIFLYRQMDKPVAATLGVDTTPFRTETIPTIFRFDLSVPTAFFALEKFDVLDSDILYVSNSLNEEIQSFFEALSLIVPLPADTVTVRALDVNL